MKNNKIIGLCAALVGLSSGALAQDATVTVEAEVAQPQAPIVQPAPVQPVQPVQ